MKKALLIMTTALLGIGLFLYPHAANYFSERNVSVAIQEYDDLIEKSDQAVLEEEWNRAQDYNKQLSGESIRDPFLEGSGMVLGEDYAGILDYHGTMGHIAIPAVQVDLAIYHGTSEEVLRKGAGHLEGSALPVGGTGTHAVLTGHTGLINARLFTDLKELTEGDLFFLYILNEVLVYEIDQIKVVEPENTEDLMPVKGEDFVTLVTCTPYGVNSHRLLVRGRRIEYQWEQDLEEQLHTAVRRFTQEQMVLITAGLVTAGIMAALIVFAAVKSRRRPPAKVDYNRPESGKKRKQPAPKKPAPKKPEKEQVRYWWDEE